MLKPVGFSTFLHTGRPMMRMWFILFKKSSLTSIFAYMIFCPIIRVSSPPLYRCSALSLIPVYKCHIMTIIVSAIKLHTTTFTAASSGLMHEGSAYNKKFWTNKQIQMMTQLVQHHHHLPRQSLRLFKILRTHMNCNQDGKSLALGKIQSHNEKTLQETNGPWQK